MGEKKAGKGATRLPAPSGGPSAAARWRIPTIPELWGSLTPEVLCRVMFHSGAFAVGRGMPPAPTPLQLIKT
ncbi:hypothetical protein EVAR_40556_1 [Eumeta japonica]|uniref:Uncharacterized protein n=1 Tax=Eumeta variegata TaxID=151549 RepID=A0A4C1VV64_EUMVA|nr:hypothetical protein EVAR_40556_1 [Eumeta japonica]